MDEGHSQKETECKPAAVVAEATLKPKYLLCA